MCRQPQNIIFSLPDWISEYIHEVDCITSLNDRVRFVIAASRLNVRNKTGGPFAAAIFEIDSGKLISLGVNIVATQGLSILHAEIIAISLAQRKLGVFDLGDQDLASHELVTSTEPCAMCFGAIPWSGVRRVVTSARDIDARSIGFDEGPKLDRWNNAFEQRGIEVKTDVQRDMAVEVLNEYASTGGQIYNSKASKFTNN